VAAAVILACVATVLIASGLKLPEVFASQPRVVLGPTRPKNPFDSKRGEQEAKRLEMERMAEMAKPIAVPDSMKAEPDPSIVEVAGTYDLGDGWKVGVTPYRGLIPSLRVTRNGRHAIGMPKGIAIPCEGGFAVAFRDPQSGEVASVYVGTNGDDVMRCDALAGRCLMLGLGGNDLLVESHGPDVLIGGPGWDVVDRNDGGDDLRDVESSGQPGGDSKASSDECSAPAPGSSKSGERTPNSSEPGKGGS